MEEDEGGDDQGVFGDAVGEECGVEEGAGVKTEVPAGREEEAADHEGDYAEENQEAEDVSEEQVGGVGDLDGEEGFEGVDQVDEKVEDEAVENEGVEEADDGALLEGAALAKGGEEGLGEALGEVVQAGFGVWAGAAEAAVKLVEGPCGPGEGDGRKEEEGELVGEGEHGLRGLLVREQD